jgi:hypothetical protein
MRTAVATILFGLGLSTVALAEDHPTYESLWNSVSSSPDCKSQDDVDLTIFTCEKAMSLWYFTKLGHPAHPGVVKRSVVEDAKNVSIDEQGWSFAPDAAQPAFKTFLAQIRALDAQMKQVTANKEAPPPNGGVAVRLEGNWKPTEGEVQSVLFLTDYFFRLEDDGHYEEAYELMDSGLTSQMPFEQYRDLSEKTKRAAGNVKSRTIKTVDWENNAPSGPSGLYAALDYTAETENGELCGYVAWREQPDHFSVLVREETNIIPNTLSPEEAGKLKTQFHCVE